MLTLLLKTHLRSIINHLLKGEAKKRWRKRLGLGGYLVFPLMIFFSMYELFHGLYTGVAGGPALITMFLSLSMSGMMLFLFFSGMTVSLHYFFLARDFNLLLAVPISQRTLFHFKFIQISFANSSIFWALGLPLIFVYGFVQHAPIWYYILSLPLAVLFLSIPTGLAGIIAIGIVRLLPAKQAKNIAATLMAFAFMAIWLGSQYFRISHYGSRPFNQQRLDQMAAISQQISHLPSDWLVKVLHSSLQGDARLAAAYSGLMLLVSAGLIYLGQRLLASHFQRSQAAVPAKKPKVRRERGLIPTSLWLSLMLHDIKLLRRDSRQLTQLLMFAVIILVFPLIMRQERGPAEAMGGFLPFIYPLIFTSLFTSTLTSKAIPLEGRSFSWIKCSPQSFLLIILVKNSVGIIFSLAFGLLSVIITSQLHGLGIGTAVQALAVLATISLASAGIGSFFGAFFAKFDWEHPKRMLTGIGNLLLTLSSIACFGLMTAIFYLFVALNGTVWGLLSMGMVAMLLFWLGTLLSVKKLESMEWRL